PAAPTMSIALFPFMFEDPPRYRLSAELDQAQHHRDRHDGQPSLEPHRDPQHLVLPCVGTWPALGAMPPPGAAVSHFIAPSHSTSRHRRASPPASAREQRQVRPMKSEARRANESIETRAPSGN